MSSVNLTDPRWQIRTEQGQNTNRCPVVNSDERDQSFPCGAGEKRFVKTTRVKRYWANKNVFLSNDMFSFFFSPPWRKLFYRYISFLPEINFSRARRKSTFNFFEGDFALFLRSLSILFFLFFSFFSSFLFRGLLMFFKTKNLSSNFVDLFQRI